MAKTDALLRLGVEGAQEFQSTLRQETNEVKRLKDEYKVLSTGFSDTDKSANRFQKQIESLTKVLDAQRRKQQEIQQMLDRLKSTTDDSDKETEEYKSTVQSLEKQLATATVEANRTEREIEKLGREMDGAEKETKETATSMDDLKQAMTKAAAVGNLVASAIKTVAKYVFQAGKAAVDYNKDMEKATKSLEAFVGADETKAMTDRMKALTRQTGVSTVTLLQQAQSLTAVGISSDKAATTIEGMSKVIMALGGDNATFERMLTNMQGIETAGKASTQDLKQFKSAGIPIMQMLSESTGKSVAELEKMDITFDMISEAFDKASQKGGMYYDAIQTGATTLDGKMNILKTTIQEGLGTAFEPVNDALSNQLLPVLLEITENIDWSKVGDGIAGAVGVISNFIQKVDEFRQWYDEIYGEKPQETINAFTTTAEGAATAFLESRGNIQVFNEELANAPKEANKFRNNMRIEMDGFGQETVGSVEQVAGTVKNTLIEYGPELMETGHTDMVDFKRGIESGEVEVKTAADKVYTSAFEQWAKTQEAERYGADFVSGFASGMHRNNGLIASAAASIASTIRSILHFSEPDEGPLVGYQTWAKDFVKGYAEGIEKNLGILREASRDMALAIADPVYNHTTKNDNRTINMTVNSAAGQNAEEVADYVIYKLGVETNRELRA